MASNTSDIVLERMMALHPKIIDLTLDRTWRLLSALEDPQSKLPPVVHLAGTNGKGSTQAMIRAGIEGAGKVVHAYTSPHLARFHERIMLAGTLITEHALTSLLEHCYKVNNGENITYFEITTCAALLAFAQTPADYTLLEVGLGGRVDATNVINKPATCVITPVDLDHQQYLGETLEEISFEKAGILKRGVTAIIGPQQDKALEVIERHAAKIGAPLLVHGQHWHVSVEAERLVYQDETGLMDLPLPSLPGQHQIQNAGAAITALKYLGFGEEACTFAVLNAYWPARMERLKSGPLVDKHSTNEIWLDGGHNPAAGRAIAATLAAQNPRETHIICGMLNTKDVGGFLRPLAPHCTSLTALTIPGETNAVPALDLEAAGQAEGINSSSGEAIDTVLKSLAKNHPHARILICGSLYLAGHVLRENSKD